MLYISLKYSQQTNDSTLTAGVRVGHQGNWGKDLVFDKKQDFHGKTNKNIRTLHGAINDFHGVPAVQRQGCGFITHELNAGTQFDRFARFDG